MTIFSKSRKSSRNINSVIYPTATSWKRMDEDVDYGGISSRKLKDGIVKIKYVKKGRLLSCQVQVYGDCNVQRKFGWLLNVTYVHNVNIWQKLNTKYQWANTWALWIKLSTNESSSLIRKVQVFILDKSMQGVPCKF